MDFKKQKNSRMSDIAIVPSAIPKIREKFSTWNAALKFHAQPMLRVVLNPNYVEYYIKTFSVFCYSKSNNKLYLI